MRIFWNVVRVIFAAFMIYAGVQHFLNPEFYLAFVPTFLPYPNVLIYGSGIVEIILGILLLIPKYSKHGAFGLFILMLIFLPIHLWDVFSDTPAIGSHKAAIYRLLIQFLFIGMAWKIKTSMSRKSRSV